MYTDIDTCNYIELAIRKCGSYSHSHIRLWDRKKELNGMLLKTVFFFFFIILD